MRLYTLYNVRLTHGIGKLYVRFTFVVYSPDRNARFYQKIEAQLS